MVRYICACMPPRVGNKLPLHGALGDVMVYVWPDKNNFEEHAARERLHASGHLASTIYPVQASPIIDRERYHKGKESWSRAGGGSSRYVCGVEFRS